jgi:hypothetical protein
LLAQQPPAAPAGPAAEGPEARQTYRFDGHPIALQGQCGEAEINEFGMSCSEDEPCPLYLELAGADSAGAHLYAAGNLHAGTVTLWSVLLASDDGGKTWTEPAERRRGAALDQVQFPTNVAGFVSGYTAGALPRDPFFLRTTDGGKTWTRHTILEDGSVGLIERFHFDSSTHGSALLDRGRPGAGRYATYETQDGGDTWTMRESSADKPARPARELPALSRIVADAVNRALRVELREGDAWRSAASFALGAGACHQTPHAPPLEVPQDPAQDNETAPLGRIH